MNKTKILTISLIASFFMIFLISAIDTGEGISLVGNKTNFDVDKTVNQVETFNISLKNNQNFPFYNLSIEKDWISIPEINLNPNQTKEVEVKVTGNKDYTGQLRIKGLFLVEDLNRNPKTHELKINDTVPEKPSFSIIKGDTVKFTTNDNRSYSICNLNNQPIGTFDKSNNFKKTFDEVVNLNYYVNYEYVGCSLSNYDTYKISVKDDSGYINQEKYDAVFNIDLKTTYPPTKINTQSLTTTKYTLDPFQSKQGTIFIENTGNNIAKNITLNGKWFDFETNNFDLTQDGGKSVDYTLQPEIYDTNETGKNYSIPVTIKGNFPEKAINFKVKINYKKIVEGNESSSGSFFERIMEQAKEYCKDNPNSEWCYQGEVVYKVDNKTYNEAQQMQQLFKFLTKDAADKSQQIKQMLKENKKIMQELNQTRQRVEGINETVSEEYQETQNTNTTLLTIVIIILTVALAYLFWRLRQHILKSRTDDWRRT